MSSEIEDLIEAAKRDEIAARILGEDLNLRGVQGVEVEAPPYGSDDLTNAQFRRELAARRLAWLRGRWQAREERIQSSERFREQSRRFQQDVHAAAALTLNTPGALDALARERAQDRVDRLSAARTNDLTEPGGIRRVRPQEGNSHPASSSPGTSPTKGTS